MSHPPLRLSFGHKARRGKDTAVDYCISKYGGKHFKFAYTLYDITVAIQERVGVAIQKDPRLMQKTADLLKEHYSDDVFAKSLDIFVEKYPNENIFISDFRHKVEALYIKKNKFTTIDVIKDVTNIDRNASHISEIDLDDYDFDYKIENNDTMESYYKKIDEMIESIRNTQICS